MFGKLGESVISRIDGTREAVSGAVSSARDGLETHKELPLRVDGLQVTVDGLQVTVDGLQVTVDELQKRLDAIEPMLNNLNIDFKMLLDVFTTNFNSTQPPANYNVFKENMSKQMRNILDVKYKREQSVTGYSSS
jgi:hypothetical protein